MADIQHIIRFSLDEAQREINEFVQDPHTVDNIAMAARYIAYALANGKKVISCGNGGSLCDATHFAEELTGRFRNNRRPLPAIAINDPAYLTCTANDFCFDDVFARYVEGIGNEGDILLAISTSGRSKNVNRAAMQALSMGMKVIALTQQGDNELSRLATLAICAPSAPHSDRIQEIHIKVIHIMIEAIEAIL